MTNKNGNTYIEVNSGGICNYYPNAHTVLNCSYMPIKGGLIAKIILKLTEEYGRLHDDLKADQLFDALKNHVSDLVIRDVDLFDNVSYEEMDNHVCIVFVDTFCSRCEMLQEM